MAGQSVNNVRLSSKMSSPSCVEMSGTASAKTKEFVWQWVSARSKFLSRRKEESIRQGQLPVLRCVIARDAMAANKAYKY